MKILVLGHRGMLGSDILAKLSTSHDVIGKSSDDFDITSLADCRRVVGEAQPDMVINATAYTDVDGCESNEEKSMSVNAEGVKNIADSCKSRDIKIVHFSTDYVFSGLKETPYREDDRTDPINVYGASKREGERYLKEFSDNYLLIRTSWLYGANGKNFVESIIRKAKQKEKLQVVADQRGSPTYTADLAAAVKLLVEDEYAGVFHITNRGNCTWYEFALKVLEYADMTDADINPITSEELKRDAPRPHYSVLSCRKFTELTKRTMRYWQIALRDYINRMNIY